MNLQQQFDWSQHVIFQWEEHGKHRATEADKALWIGDEPDEVAMARAFLNLLANSMKFSDEVIALKTGLRNIASMTAVYGESAGNYATEVLESVQ